MKLEPGQKIKMISDLGEVNNFLENHKCYGIEFLRSPGGILTGALIAYIPEEEMQDERDDKRKLLDELRSLRVRILEAGGNQLLDDEIRHKLFECIDNLIDVSEWIKRNRW